MKQLITVNRSGINGKFFLMNNTCGVDGKPKGQVPWTPYYDTMRDASIAMFRLPAEYTNIYDMSQKSYEALTSNN